VEDGDTVGVGDGDGDALGDGVVGAAVGDALGDGVVGAGEGDALGDGVVGAGEGDALGDGLADGEPLGVGPGPPRVFMYDSWASSAKEFRDAAVELMRQSNDPP
jgi:hypothetical protein